MNRTHIIAGGALLIGGLVGCSSSTSTTGDPAITPAARSHEPSAEGAKYRLQAEPADAQDVIAVRADAADGETVTVVGRIGGDVNPWIDGRAAFTIVDNSLLACSDIEGDACPTPWDYCCETDKLKTGKILVKFVDEQGNLIATDAKELLGLGELDTVVVEGTMQKSEDGAAVILASGVYLREPGEVHAAAGAAHDHDHDHDHDHGEVGHDYEHGEEGHADEGEATKPSTL